MNKKSAGKAHKGPHHPSKNSSSGATLSQGWSSMSLACTRCLISTASIGRRKPQRASDCFSSKRYFSVITRFSGHGFSERIYRRAPGRGDIQCRQHTEGGERQTGVIEELAAVFTTHLDFQGEISQQLYDLGHMIIILGEELSLTMWIKEKVSCQELKDLEKVKRSDRVDVNKYRHTTQATLHISARASQSRLPRIASGARY